MLERAQALFELLARIRLGQACVGELGAGVKRFPKSRRQNNVKMRDALLCEHGKLGSRHATPWYCAADCA